MSGVDWWDVLDVARGIAPCRGSPSGARIHLRSVQLERPFR
jgi:hypothetical protein